jgi:ABC-2 type transport system permease protein
MTTATAPSVAAPAASPASHWLLPIASLTEREIVRFLRQRSRAIGSFAQPIIFWVLFGVGFRGSFQMAESGGPAYGEFFLPGIAALIVMFTSIFSAISVIQDRNEGFLQGALAAPVPRTSLVLGKLWGGTLLAVIQGVIFLGLAALLGTSGVMADVSVNLSFGGWLATIGILSLLGIGLCGLGFAFAWKIDSIQGFHAIMSLLLFPMWLLSGSFFPAQGSGWLQWVIAVNPLTYGVAALRRVMSASDSAALTGVPSMAVCLAVIAAFAAVCVVIDVRFARRDLK